MLARVGPTHTESWLSSRKTGLCLYRTKSDQKLSLSQSTALLILSVPVGLLSFIWNLSLRWSRRGGLFHFFVIRLLVVIFHCMKWRSGKDLFLKCRRSSIHFPDYVHLYQFPSPRRVQCLWSTQPRPSLISSGSAGDFSVERLDTCLSCFIGSCPVLACAWGPSGALHTADKIIGILIEWISSTVGIDF